MLSTYQTIANHVEYLSKSFSGDKLLDSIIIDEAHKIKNKDAKCSMALKTLGSASKFGLTGTPIMNKLVSHFSSTITNLFFHPMYNRLNCILFTLGVLEKICLDRYQSSVPIIPHQLIRAQEGMQTILKKWLETEQQMI